MGVFGSVPKIEMFSSLSGVWIAAGLPLDDSICGLRQPVTTITA
jgi:hypothetical protein